MAKGIGFVDTRSGKARVNWYRGDRMGVSYLELEGDSGDAFCNVLTEDEVEFNYGKVFKSEEKPDVRKETQETLQERLKRLRRERRSYGKRKKKSTKKTTKRKTTRKKKPKKPKTPEEAIKSLSAKEKAALKAMLKGGD